MVTGGNGAANVLDAGSGNDTLIGGAGDDTYVVDSAADRIGEALGLSERAVEKHINSVFSKLALSEEPDSHRRVKAVLLYLADQT